MLLEVTYERLIKTDLSKHYFRHIYITGTKEIYSAFQNIREIRNDRSMLYDDVIVFDHSDRFMYIVNSEKIIDEISSKILEKESLKGFFFIELEVKDVSYKEIVNKNTGEINVEKITKCFYKKLNHTIFY